MRRISTLCPSQVDISNHRREHIRQLREEWSRESPLLKLPGEIRNRIYHFAIEPALVQLRICSLPQAPRFGSPNTADWASSKRKALGLTQTCRMLRAEVLLLHRKAHSVHATVCYTDSAQELDLELLDEHNVVRLRKNGIKDDGITVNIKKLACSMLAGEELSECVDIKSPYWRPRARAFMTRLMEAFGEKSFQEFLMTEARTATVTFGRQLPALAIEVRESQVQTWMPWHSTTTTQRDCVGAKVWLEMFGLREVGVEVGQFDIWTGNCPGSTAH